MKIKYLLVYILITITLVVCGCNKAGNKQPKKQNNIKIKQLPSNNLKKVNAKSNKTITSKNTPRNDIDLTDAPEIKEMLKGAQKLYFNEYDYDSNNKYVQIVKKMQHPEVFEKGLSLLVTDLNNDGNKDILSMPVDTPVFGTFILITPKYSESYRIRTPINTELPIYILNTTTNGLKDVIINNKYLCKFDEFDFKCTHINIKNLTKNAQKFTFDYYQDDFHNKYVQKVIEWAKKDSKDETIYKMNMRHGLAISLVDLNNDNKLDILSVPGLGGWCGSSPTSGCSVIAFLSPEYKKPYKLTINVIIQLPVYVLKSTTNGLKDLLINEKFVCNFNNNQYICK
ncbi:MAG: hypothetical protein AB1782_20700 [Cyanobacteriota bacterium]